jgi:hypothetical protein
MKDFAFVQIGERRQADMGVRSDVERLTGRHVSWPHVIEKDEWANHATLNLRQHPADE